MRIFDKNKVFATQRQNDKHADKDCHHDHDGAIIVNSESVEATLHSIIINAPIHTDSERLTTFQETAPQYDDVPSTPRADEHRDQNDNEDETHSMDIRDDDTHDSSASSSQSSHISDCRDDDSLSDGMNDLPSHEVHQVSSALPLSTSSALRNYHNSESFHRSSAPSTAPNCKYQSILRPSKYSKCNTTSDGECQITSKPKSPARFSVVEIREYPIALGDNPGGVQGPPICLDWKHDAELTVLLLLNEYEATRPPRRCQEELYLPECLRRWKLLEKGVSMRAMQKATKSAENVRRQRRNTIRSIQSQPGPLSSFTDMVRQLVGS